MLCSDNAFSEDQFQHTREGTAGDLRVRVDIWCDLVYHVLSYLPLAENDASSMYNRRYVQWANQQFAELAPPGLAVPRTLLEDAVLMASLYASSKQGFLLHAWPLLDDSVEVFLQHVSTDFAQLTWARAEGQRLARAINSNTHPALADLFRTALWSELANGFERIWEKNVWPKSRAYYELFAGRIADLSQKLPGLREITWVLSHPLRTQGRLLRSTAASPTIVVGVADTDLGVDGQLPVMQGCHEYFVCRVHSRAPTTGPWGTIFGREGYGAFRSVEDGALVLGARFFVGSRWEESYHTWLGCLFPDDSPAETAKRLTAGESLSAEMVAHVGTMGPG